ncbi:MAG TPA: branched-chain amino acid ABC transporter substrate-binding protein [Solirubrobacter sp.]|nr:branched-chain amino acid ABC transporter substrate-binding protein [Solirubrobacter sp.]
MGAVLVVLLAGCGGSAKEPPSKKPVQIWTRGDISFGVLAPLTGAEADRGRDLVDGAKLAAEDLNVRGGVLGKEVKLLTHDDRCEAAAGRASAQELAGQAPAGVLGGVCDDAAKAAARTLGKDLPFLVTAANSPRIVSRKQTPTAYLTNGTPYQAALAALHFLVLDNAHALATVSTGDRASKTLADQVIGLASPSPKAVSQQTIDASADVAQVAKTALAAKPDAVYFAGPAATSGTLLAALRAAKYDGSFVASAESESPEFVQAAGDAAPGAFVIAPASPQNLPEAAEWTKRFQERFERPPGRDALLGYNALRALSQAVTQSGKIDAERNAAELSRLPESYGGFLGALRFAADHTVMYDNNIALTVGDDGSFKLANTLRSSVDG